MKHRIARRVIAMLFTMLFAFGGVLAESMLSLPESVTIIGEEAFEGISVPSVHIPYGAKRIESRAFAGSSIGSILIPETVEYIAPDAFEGSRIQQVQSTYDSCAEDFAASSGIGFSALEAGNDDWRAAPALTELNIIDGNHIELVWQGNGAADAYGVYEVMDASECLVTVSEGERTTIYSPVIGLHSYLIRPLRRDTTPMEAGEASNVLSGSVYHKGRMAAPVVFLAEESSPGEVWLEWNPSPTTDRYTVWELKDGAYFQIRTTTDNEAYFDGVETGSHTYAVQAIRDELADYIDENGDRRKGHAADSVYSGPCTVQVAGPVTEIIMSASELRMHASDTETIHISVVPFNTTDCEPDWISSDESVATVDYDGLVTAVATGEATITARAESGASASCTVTVEPDDVYEKDGLYIVNGCLRSLHFPTYVATHPEAWRDSTLYIPGDLGIRTIGYPALPDNLSIFGCPDSLSVVVPEGVTTLGPRALSIRGLKSVTLPDSLTTIMDRAFEDCGLEAFSITEGVTTIGDRAFDSCTRLESVHLPDSLQYIGQYAFRACSALTSIEIPDGVSEIGEGAFLWCRALENVKLPATLTVIENNLFGECKSLPSIDIPDTVTDIEASAFFGCTSLTEVHLPESLITIGSYAFSGDSAYYIDGAPINRLVIPPSVEYIGDYAFDRCKKLVSVELPDSVNTIGDGAFKGCERLYSIELPANLEYLGHSAFANCTELSGLSFRGNQLEMLQYQAFYGCGGLNSVTLPDGLRTIGFDAFAHCSNLEYVYIPDGVTTIDLQAFSGDPIRAIRIPDSVDSIIGDLHRTISLGTGHYKGYVYCSPDSYAASLFPTRNRPKEYYDLIWGSPEMESALSQLTWQDGEILMGNGMILASDTLFGMSVNTDVASSDESVVMVKPYFANIIQVTAKTKGVATLTATSKETGEALTRTVRVVGGFSEPSLTLAAGDAAQLATDWANGFSGSDNLYIDDITTRETSHDTISIEQNGTIRANHNGLVNLRINVVGHDHLYTSCSIGVMDAPREVTVEPVSQRLGIGETLTLKASVNPGAMDRGFTYSSSDPNVATVTQDGVVTMCSTGSAVISATTYNGVRGTCAVFALNGNYNIEDAARLRAHIDKGYNWLMFMNRFLDGGGTSPTGYTIDGVDVHSLTDSILLRAYAALLNGETGAIPELGDLKRASQLVDILLTDASDVSETDYTYLTLQEIRKSLSGVKELGGQIEQLLEVFTYLADKDGIVRLNPASWGKYAGKPFEEYGDLFKELGYWSDAAKALESLVNGIRKCKVYSHVSPTLIDSYIRAFKCSGSSELRLAAKLLEFYRIQPQVMTYASYGIVPCVKSLIKYAFGESPSLIPDNSAPNTALLLIKAVNTYNNVFMNIDEIQAAAYKAEFAVDRANAYRPVFQAAYIAHLKDPFNNEKFLDLVECYNAFSALVSAEYIAMSDLPTASRGGVTAKLNNLYLAIKNFDSIYLFDDGSEESDSFKQSARFAESVMTYPLRDYGVYILGISRFQVGRLGLNNTLPD